MNIIKLEFYESAVKKKLMNLNKCVKIQNDYINITVICVNYSKCRR